ncbi:MAG: alkaline phosphatase family protein, partial [Candidatus Ranarchaeia archaeon]
MKILILGLDGCTWKVLKPLFEIGILPNLQKIVDDGCTAILESTIPPTTSPAWPCMATGMNPGKLGVFGTLFRKSKDDYKLSVVTSMTYKGKSFWDTLSKKNYKSALVKIPFLYPAYEVNGYMISGFGSTGKLAVYPKHLYKKIKSGPNEFRARQLFGKKINLDDLIECQRYIQELQTVLQEEAQIALEMVRELSWDLFFYVVSMTDWIQHNFMDRIHEVIRKMQTKRFVDLDIVDNEILKFYQILDELVEQLRIVLEKEEASVFFIVSDHGFTIRPFTFNIGKWLVDQGYMTMREDSGGGRVPQKIYDLINRLPWDPIIKLLPTRVLSNLLDTYLNISVKRQQLITNRIDYERSSVYCLDDYSIYINPLLDKDTIITRLIMDLKETLQPYEVNPIFFKCHEIYTGNYTDLAPDLLLEIHDDDYQWEKSVDLSKPLVFKPHNSGIHNRYGIFVAYGSQINKGVTLHDIKIYDIAPTIL